MRSLVIKSVILSMSIFLVELLLELFAECDTLLVRINTRSDSDAMAKESTQSLVMGRVCRVPCRYCRSRVACT